MKKRIIIIAIIGVILIITGLIFLKNSNFGTIVIKTEQNGISPADVVMDKTKYVIKTNGAVEYYIDGYKRHETEDLGKLSKKGLKQLKEMCRDIIKQGDQVTIDYGDIAIYSIEYNGKSCVITQETRDELISFIKNNLK